MRFFYSKLWAYIAVMTFCSLLVFAIIAMKINPFSLTTGYKVLVAIVPPIIWYCVVMGVRHMYPFPAQQQAMPASRSSHIWWMGIILILGDIFYLLVLAPGGFFSDIPRIIGHLLTAVVIIIWSYVSYRKSSRKN